MCNKTRAHRDATRSKAPVRVGDSLAFAATPGRSRWQPDDVCSLGRYRSAGIDTRGLSRSAYMNFTSARRTVRKRSVVLFLKGGEKLPYCRRMQRPLGGRVYPSYSRFDAPVLAGFRSYCPPRSIPPLLTLVLFLSTDPGSWCRQLKIFGFSRGSTVIKTDMRSMRDKEIEKKVHRILKIVTLL